MLDNFYDLYELKQKEYMNRRFKVKTTMKFSLNFPSPITKIKELLKFKKRSSQTICCQAF